MNLPGKASPIFKQRHPRLGCLFRFLPWPAPWTLTGGSSAVRAHLWVAASLVRDHGIEGRRQESMTTELMPMPWQRRPDQGAAVPPATGAQASFLS